MDRVRTLSRVSLLASLYFAQGLPFGIFTQALPVMMRQAGHSLENIGLSNLLALPWALKFAWAAAVDSVPGPRSRVILPLNLLAAVLLLGLAFTAPGAIAALVVVVFLCNLVAATQDIATDALAVELLPPGERGLGNGVQVAGYRLGMIVGGGVLVQLFDTWGWQSTFSVAAAALLLASVPLLLATQPPRQAPTAPAVAREAVRWDRWFAGPAGLRWFGLLVIYKLGDSFGTGMAKPMLVDQGLTLGEIGRLMGLYGSLSGLLGALIGGWLVSRFSPRSALVGFALLQTLTLLLYAWLAHAGPGLVREAVVLEHLVSGMATAALFTVMMDTCRPGHAGTDYTVQASVVVIGQGLSAVVSGWSAGGLGYLGHFLLSVAFALLAAAYAARMPTGSERFAVRA